jgi:predicted N-acyltransferase
MTLSLKIHDSVGHLSDAELDALTADSSVFFGRHWLRMLEAVDLASLVRGELSLRYAIVTTQQGTPVALCPFFVTRSKTIYTPYSLEKFFFTSWKPGIAKGGGWGRVAVTVADLYQSLAWMSGAGAEGGICVTSPLSMRASITCAGPSPDVVRQARALVIQGLQEFAASEQLPIYFYGVDSEDTALREALTGAAFQELYIFDDNVIDVRGENFEAWLGQFKSDARRLLKKEMASARDAGVRFERVSRLGEMGEQLERFYETTYSKYSKDHLRHPPAFWAALEQHVQPQAEAVVAYQGSEPIGFSLLLHKREDLWFYRVGRAEADASETPLYFNLAFYEPMRRAYELGAKRLWLGPSGYETKRRRGARRHGLYSYMWIPRRWSRTVLQPYLSVYAKVSQAMAGGSAQKTRMRKAS